MEKFLFDEISSRNLVRIIDKSFRIICQEIEHIGLLLHIAAIQTERSELIPYMENFFI